jgi:DNA-binding protein YbaB
MTDRIDEVSQAAIDAMAKMDEAVRKLAAVEIDGLSSDRRVAVRISAGGRITQFRLRPDVLHRYDSTGLGEVVTRTIRETQLKARANYERAAAELVPPEVAASQQELQRIWRD